MLHEDYLMGWSNAMGFKKRRYETILDDSANIGTIVHDSIDIFIKTGKIRDISDKPIQYIQEVNNAFSAFLNWWRIINIDNKVEILFNEQKLICTYFGGTLDLLVKINGKIYLVDFKTSKQVSQKYHYQLAAYAIMLKWNYDIDIDGIIILLLSKNHIGGLFSENVLIFSKIEHKMYFESCKDTFMSLVFGYYNRRIMEDSYENIRRER
jgi:hypothetical protein